MKGCIVLKIKNSSNAVSPDAAIIIMCFGILISCPLRIFLMLKNTDTVTGFYEDYGNIGVYALYGVLALVTVLVLLLTYLSGRIPASVAPKGRHIILGLSSFVFAGTLFYDAVSNYISNGPSTATIIQNVQNYIDPNINGDGSGVAPIGAICQVYGAKEKALTISGTVEPDNTIDSDEVLENIQTALTEYLSKINFNTTEVSYAKLLNIAIGCEGVNDITDFRLNNGYSNISCDETEIFYIGSFDMEVE